MKNIIIGLLAIAVFSIAGYNYTNSKKVGSVVQNSQYEFTQLTGPIATTSLIVGGMTTLGSVIVTETQAGAVVIWDATSTAAVDNGVSVRVADIKSAIGEGTYTFDTGLTYGLVVVSDDGYSFAGDWTLTWRRGW